MSAGIVRFGLMQATCTSLSITHVLSSMRQTHTIVLLTHVNMCLSALIRKQNGQTMMETVQVPIRWLAELATGMLFADILSS